MGNHFHLLVKMRPASDFSDKEIRERYPRIYGEDRDLPDDRLPAFRKKLASLSELIRDIKVTFARYYNHRHHRSGIEGRSTIRYWKINKRRIKTPVFQS